MDPAALTAIADRLVGHGETLEPVLPEPYVPHVPTPRQAAFLSPPVTLIEEVFFGGAARGGKSDALLMAALQYVDVPGYSALLLRRTFAELAKPDALMHRAHQWLGPTDAAWSNETHSWTFPSGATVTFGYLEHARDEEQYQSAAYQMIGFDELTEFPEYQYRFLFSRLSRPIGMDVPIRMRSASNPVGPGKGWVQARFVDLGPRRDRLFIPSRLEDNPYVDQESYDRQLRRLGSILYRQLRHGDWDVKPEGKTFKRAWFPTVAPTEIPADCRRVRYWDLASTETPQGAAARRLGDPDWTAGLRLARSSDGRYFVEDVARFREGPKAAETRMLDVTERDGRTIPVRMEQEGGASGKRLVALYRRTLFDGYDFRGVTSSASKELRAAPIAPRAESGEVLLVRGDWNEAFLDEIAEFPDGLHDDQVDALSGAFAFLAGRHRRGRPAKPQGFQAGSHWLDS